MSEKTWEYTEEHKKQVPAWNERWIKIIMSTEPIDFQRTKKACLEMYEFASLKVPRVVYAQSCFTGSIVLAASAAMDKSKLNYKTKDPFIRSILDAAGEKIVQYDGPYEREPLGSTPLEQLTKAKELLEPLNIDYKVFLQVMENWSSYYVGGSEWASWPAFLSFVRDVVGFKHPSQKQYKPYEEAAIYGGPRFTTEEVVVLCDRALERNLDETRRPHNESGPSLTWRCGMKQWHIHDVAVDEQIVMRPETQTISQIEADGNAEVKRIRIERFGWVRYLSECGATVIDQRRNDRDAQNEVLYKLKDGQHRFRCVDPSTGREYALGVPRDVTTCQAAQNWMSSGLDEFAIHRS